MNIQVGDTIQANKMAPDSFYRRAIGTVTAVRNGFVQFTATRVQSKWDADFQDHPGGGCATAARLSDVELI